jgi:CheY-like chemotaxis protein
MSKRILVVEDQPDNRQIIRDMLAPTDYEITEGESGGEALTAIARQRPDLILMDIRLPIMDGYTATSQGTTVISAPCSNDADIQSAFTARARDGSGGIIGIADTFVADHCDLIIALAAQHRLPAIYGHPIFARSGGLMVYSPDYADIYRRAADYVDRILRGARPAELPVQEPDKFTLSVNLKVARRAISLNLPQTLIARADEVIE